MTIKKTPLQDLLIENIVPDADICQHCGINRVTLWRWKNGDSYPERKHATKLIELFGEDRLDYNGCYKTEAQHGED